MFIRSNMLRLLVLAAKQQVQLSDSYLPVAMQVIAHLTDQMAFEVKDDVPKSTTARPLYVTSDYFASLPKTGWWIRYGIARDTTTAFHKPGLYAPASPPKPSERQKSNNYVLLPVEQNYQHTIIEPQEKKTEEPLLAVHNEEVSPLLEPPPNHPHHLLPYNPIKYPRSSDDEFNEENLQYLSPQVRDMIRMAKNPDDERLIDVWDGLRANPLEVSSRGKLSTSNLRLLLLYDLLSRDAKRQRLSDYSGFSPDVMKNLVESSDGGASEQLRFALSKMVERNDCGNDYANNRAKEMVVELAKAESKLSSELRYLQPLVYKF
ncbi:unnamed protein product [Danaus chrysippus]|uniref:(African queen) hypothetical protein n=2 Tax=Danaus chrysippus TaxID=151541 RepID=A0A8J2MIP0_9NEOP|nr:unnamed protein product [Danaus chrysippus]